MHEQAAGGDCSTVPSDPWTLTLALQPSPPCCLDTDVRCRPVLSSGGSCGFFYRRLWRGERAGLEGRVASEVRLSPFVKGVAVLGLHLPEHTPRPSLLSFFPRCPQLPFFPCVPLLPKASFSPFQKISGVQSEARVAGTCSLWGLSLFLTHTLTRTGGHAHSGLLGG